MTLLEKWKNQEELITKLKIIVVRLDNIVEIREKLDKWSRQGVQEEPTIPYEGLY